MRALLHFLMATAVVAASAACGSAQTIPSAGGGAGFGFGYLGPGYLGYHWANPTVYSQGMYPGTGILPGPIFLNDPPPPIPLIYRPWFSGPVVLHTKCGTIVCGSKAAGTAGETGLRVVEVKDGPAQSAGIPQGAVIVQLGGRRVRTPDELKSALRAAPNTVPLTYIEATGERVVREVTLLENRLGVSVIAVPVRLPTTDASVAGR